MFGSVSSFPHPRALTAQSSVLIFTTLFIWVKNDEISRETTVSFKAVRGNEIHPTQPRKYVVWLAPQLAHLTCDY